MPAFVKTKEQEELWARAKEQAAKAGHAEEWDYVTAIYKQMNGGKVAVLETRTAYGKAFLDWAHGRKFLSPKSNKEVEFESLPADKQKQVHDEWAHSQKKTPQAPRDSKKIEELESWAKDPSRKPPDSLLGSPYIRPHAEIVDGKRKVRYHLTDQGDAVLARRQKRSGAISRVAARWIERASRAR